MKKRIGTIMLAVFLMLGVAVVPVQAMTATEDNNISCECYTPVTPFDHGHITTD